MMLCGVGSFAYGDSSPNQEMIQMKLQQLMQVDE